MILRPDDGPEMLANLAADGFYRVRLGIGRGFVQLAVGREAVNGHIQELSAGRAWQVRELHVAHRTDLDKKSCIFSVCSARHHRSEGRLCLKMPVVAILAIPSNVESITYVFSIPG